jgi:hypothetical protein
VVQGGLDKKEHYQRVDFVNEGFLLLVSFEPVDFGETHENEKFIKYIKINRR